MYLVECPYPVRYPVYPSLALRPGKVLIHRANREYHRLEDDLMVSVEGKDIPAMSVIKDQKLRFYLPESQVSAR